MSLAYADVLVHDEKAVEVEVPAAIVDRQPVGSPGLQKILGLILLVRNIELSGPASLLDLAHCIFWRPP